jgi:hypothetical protein
VTRTPSGTRCNVNWPGDSNLSVKLRLQNSQSQKNTGVRLVAEREPESADLAVATDSKANSFPFPSFRNRAVHVGLAHLPRMGIPPTDLMVRDDVATQMGNAFSRIVVCRFERADLQVQSLAQIDRLLAISGSRSRPRFGQSFALDIVGVTT